MPTYLTINRTVEPTGFSRIAFGYVEGESIEQVEESDLNDECLEALTEAEAYGMLDALQRTIREAFSDYKNTALSIAEDFLHKVGNGETWMPEDIEFALESVHRAAEQPCKLES